MTKNIKKFIFSISRDDRSLIKNQKPKLIWFTGLSGSGKSTLSNATEKKLFELGFHTLSVDGDNVRNGLCSDLSFTSVDRTENLRRIAEISKLILDAGIIVLASFISPYKSDRENIKKIVGEDNFLEIFVDTPLKICEKRDVKGLYKKARSGLIDNFTGVSAPYERPDSPFLKINTEKINIDQSIKLIISSIKNEIK